MENSKKPPKADASRKASAALNSSRSKFSQIIHKALHLPPPGIDVGVVWVGFSGGLDSTVLLHGLRHEIQRNKQWNGFTLQAIHVNHRLQKAAFRMEQHCRTICRSIGVPLTVQRPNISAQTISEMGTEAAARQARKSVFNSLLKHQASQAIALGHHQNDLVETMMLQWMRGAGLEGLCAIPSYQNLTHGMVWRPLLDVDKDALSAYAQYHQLAWVEDPTNADSQYDRNRLRQEVFPVLRSMRAGSIAAMARSVSHLQTARGLLEQVTSEDLRQCLATADPSRLLHSALCRLPAPRIARVLRHWIAQKGLVMPPTRRLEEFCRQLVSASPASRATLAVQPSKTGGEGGFRVRLRAGFLSIDLDAPNNLD